jgi:putative DNA primase/helicase
MTLPPLLQQVFDTIGDDEPETERVNGDANDALLLPPPSEPMAVARFFIRQCLHENRLTLRYWRGGWWMWKTTHWVEVDDGVVRSILYRFTEHALYRQGHACALGTEQAQDR